MDLIMKSANNFGAIIEKVLRDTVINAGCGLNVMDLVLGK